MVPLVEVLQRGWLAQRYGPVQCVRPTARSLYVRSIRRRTAEQRCFPKQCYSEHCDFFGKSFIFLCYKIYVSLVIFLLKSDFFFPGEVPKNRYSSAFFPRLV